MIVSGNFPDEWSCKTIEINALNSYEVVDSGLDSIHEIIRRELETIKSPSIKKFEIKKVIRHENVKTYLQYTIEKEAISKSSGLPKENIEEYLWYPYRIGVDKDEILKYGFNIPRQPRVLLREGLGTGIHFYRNPFLLLNEDIVKENDGYAVMYYFILCRCLVGRSHSTRARHDIEAPINFDSVQSEDMNVVLMHNTLRIYPQYYVHLKIEHLAIENIVIPCRKFSIMNSKPEPDKKILFTYNQRESAAAAARNSASSNVENKKGLYAADSRASSTGPRPTKIRKQRILKRTKRQRIYFPPRVDDEIVAYFRAAKQANTFVVDLPHQWTQYYTDKTPTVPKVEILTDPQFNQGWLDCSIYREGKFKNHTLDIYVDKDLVVEVPDIGFRIIMKRPRNLIGQIGYPTIYREDFPPVLTPVEVDLVMKCKCKHILTEIELKDFASRITESIKKKRGYEDVVMSPFFLLEKELSNVPLDGDYCVYDQKIYKIPFNKFSNCISLRIPDPIWVKIKPSWPPVILDFDIRQLIYIYRRLKLRNQSSFFKFECDDLAKKTEGLGSGFFEYINLSMTQHSQLSSKPTGYLEDANTFVFPVEGDVGVRITRITSNTEPLKSPYQKERDSNSFSNSISGGST
jgi:hypothetical protein